MSDILVKQDGPILHIRLNRPERGNADSDRVAGLTRLVSDMPFRDAIEFARDPHAMIYSSPEIRKNRQ